MCVCADEAVVIIEYLWADKRTCSVLETIRLKLLSFWGQILPFRIFENSHRMSQKL